MIDLSLFALLGILELLFLLLIGAVVMFVQWRSASRQVEDLQQRLAAVRTDAQSGSDAKSKSAKTDKPGEDASRDYADYLREQIEHSSRLLGEGQDETADDAAESDAQADLAADETRQMLAARHQFLQMELDVQADLDGTPAEQRAHIVAAMRALLDGLSHADTDIESDQGQAPDGERAQRSEEDKLRDQVGYLRSVIDNQHGVMKELRELIESHDGDSEELQAALDKLNQVESQGKNMRQRMRELERGAAPTAASLAGAASSGSSPDADMLKDLVSSQQHTIQNLKQLLQKVAPEGDKAQEFTAAMDKIQRTNNELNSCVMILEDENAGLRDEVESLQRRLSDLEARPTGAGSDAGEDADLADSAMPEVAEPTDLQTEPQPATDADVAATQDDQPEPAESETEAMGAVAGRESEGASDDTAVAEDEADIRVASLSDGAADQDDIDALLAAAAPAVSSDKQTDAPPMPESAAQAQDAAATDDPATTDADTEATAPKIKSVTEGSSDQEDIDSLLNDLFGGEPADSEGKSK